MYSLAYFEYAAQIIIDHVYFCFELLRTLILYISATEYEPKLLFTERY